MKKLVALPIILLFCVGSLTFAAGDNDDGPVVDTEISELALSKLTPEQIAAQSSDAIDGMRGTLTSTQELLQKARDGKEGILTLNCINQKMAAMKGFVKVSEQQSAVIAKNTDRKIKENSYRLIFISSDRVDSLYEEALNCVGESSRFVTKTEVNRITPDIADVEVIEIDDDRFDDIYIQERIPELTPYQ